MTAAVQPASGALLIRFGAVAAVLGGALRIISSFVPYQADQPGLEALYALIDLCLLFGLMGVYLAFAEKLGAAGFVFFAAAMAGLASIVGPDAQMFGVDFYRAGALVFVLALGAFSVQLLRARTLMLSAVLWIGALGCSLGSRFAPVAFLGTGVLLGAGYVLAGIAVFRSQSQ